MKGRRMLGVSIKEALDNLPSGVCFFNEKGLPVLCNRAMYRIAYALTGRDLQMQAELEAALNHPPEASGVKRDGEVYLLPDGGAWQFASRSIAGDSPYTEYIASDVTELYRRKLELQRSTEAHEQMVDNLKKIVNNVAAITREEEILTMKMQLHGKVGVCLQQLRRFHAAGCPAGERAGLARQLQGVIDGLKGEIGQSDDVDALDELLRVAATLGADVRIDGEVPRGGQARSLMAMILRECITNALRHAQGSAVHMTVTRENGQLRFATTNDGAPPAGPIAEGGGLTSLRRQVERAGGSMQVQSQPFFCLTCTLGEESEEDKA